MPVPSVLFLAASFDLTCTSLSIAGYPLPCRLSSIAAGNTSRPGVYFLIEDIVAVDGAGGWQYRKALDAWYCASPTFRTMLESISLFWSLSALCVGAALTTMIFLVPPTIGFGIGKMSSLINESILIGYSLVRSVCVGGSMGLAHYNLGWSLSSQGVKIVQ